MTNTSSLTDKDISTQESSASWTVSRRSSDIDMYVAKRIRERRKKLKKSQQDMAEKLGISYQQVQKYESGFNRISAGKLYAIAVLLDVSINYFFLGLQGEGLNLVSGKATKTITTISNEDVKEALTNLIDAIAESPMAN